MNVYFYKTFGKRNNSTKRPSIDTTQTPLPFDILDCKLKQNTSEHDPVFILSTNEFGYGYAYAVDWHKFYYTVDVISLANGLVEYRMTEDLLASYKYNIGATQSRIMYSSRFYDASIIDSRVQVKNQFTASRSVGSSAVVSGTYGYLVTVFNTAGNLKSSGMSVTYLLSENGMDKLRGWLGLSGVAAAISQYMNGTLLEAIVDCIWIPYYNEILYSGNVTARSQMIIGDRYSFDDDGVSFSILDKECCTLDTHLVIHTTSVVSTGLRYNDYRRYEPYTKSAIFLPGVGTLSLCAGEWRGSKINVNVYLECITGDMKYILMDDSNNIIMECNTNIAAKCALGQMVQNGSGVMSGIGQAAAGAAALAVGAVSGGSGTIIAGAAFATIAGIANTVLAANQHSASVSGGNANRLAAFNTMIIYYEISVDTENPNNVNYIALQGRPYNGVSVIAALTDPDDPDDPPVVPIYVKTIDARVDPEELDADLSVTQRPTMREQNEINDILNNGFYYE